jgi:hypothetical protein
VDAYGGEGDSNPRFELVPCPFVDAIRNRNQEEAARRNIPRPWTNRARPMYIARVDALNMIDV